jgi:hypothetical protein
MPSLEEVAMSKAVLFATVLVAASMTAAWSAPVRHAGEWETTIDKGQPLVACFPVDETFDEKFMMQSMSKLPGTTCKVENLKTEGNVTSYSMHCDINGSPMNSSATITVTGPDAFATKVHTEGATIKMPNGQTVPIPAGDTVTVAHRLGPCKPGERQITH